MFHRKSLNPWEVAVDQSSLTFILKIANKTFETNSCVDWFYWSFCKFDCVWSLELWSTQLMWMHVLTQNAWNLYHEIYFTVVIIMEYDKLNRIKELA